MRGLSALVLAGCFLSLILSAEDQAALRSRVVQEAEALQQHARMSNKNEDQMFQMHLKTLVFGLKKAATKTGNLDLDTYRTITGSAPAIGDYMEEPGSVGHDLWMTLCSDMVKMLMATSTTGTPGELRSVASRCPSAPGLLGSLPSEKKQPWPDITEPLRSYKDANVGIDFKSYRVPGILTRLYSGDFNNVADDRNTRDYVASIVTGFIKHCGKQYDTVANSYDLGNYVLFYEQRNQRRTIASANSHDFDAAIGSLTSMGVSGRHVNQNGVNDGEAITRHFGCDGTQARKLYDNIEKLGQSRKDMPPDVPNNTFFRAQMIDGSRPDLLFEDADANLMHSVRKGCENSISNVTRDQEGYCRCQAQMLFSANVSHQELGQLASHFAMETLEPIAKRYPSYEKLRNSCYK